MLFVRARVDRKLLTMVKASKRPRANSTDTDAPEPVEAATKRSRRAQPEPAPLPREQGDAANAPVRDRREVMADVARRQVDVCVWWQGCLYSQN